MPKIPGVKLRGHIWGRPLIEITRPLPLVGVVAFGVIDRGTNVLQVRPTTLCPLSCIFCSVDAGPKSRHRLTEYIVEYKWLAEWVEKIASIKGVKVEALIDGVGDPLTYPWITELVSTLKSSSWVSTVALETHGASLSIELVDKLEEAGLDRINFSIESLDREKARILAGTAWFDIERVKRVIEYVARETSIDVHVTPVWLPGVNDNDVKEIIEWALRIGAGKRWPPATVQKYVKHRYGRNPAGIREPSWKEFKEFVLRLGNKLGVNLMPSMKEWGMRYTPRLENPYHKGQIIKLQVIAPGWLKGEKLAVTLKRDRLMTLIDAQWLEEGDIVMAKVIRDKDNIYIARPI
ncbi:MAG: radical SAM protein [Pyrodictiaceae archaeon]